MKKMSLLFLMLMFHYLNGQTWQDTLRRLDKLLDGYNSQHPGIQLAVSRGGELIYSRARGMSNLEYEIPLTTTSNIEAGSVSKQFTAAAVLLLEQQGKLSLEDDIRKYVPEIPDYGTVIRIRHLINHTSGLKDWGSVASLSGWPRSTRAYDNEDALIIICRQQSLNNIPGDEFIYSNSNYNLMAIIVGRVSGKSLAEFTKEYIFIPAGMTHTSWRDDYQRIVKDRATAYNTTGSKYATLMPNENAYGNGGLLTTAEDLLIWNRYYLSGKLGNPSLKSKQLATYPLNNGKPNEYAAGLFLDNSSGWQVIQHSGATAGYRANLAYYTQLDLSIGWLSNNAGVHMTGIPEKINQLLIPDWDSKKQNLVLQPDTSVAISLFYPFAGSYSHTASGEGLLLSVKENKIYSNNNGGELLPLNDSTLIVGRGRLIFRNTRPLSVLMLTAGGDTLLYELAEPVPADLSEYVGTYFSKEADGSLYIEKGSDALLIDPGRGMKDILAPLYKDRFSAGDMQLTFGRDEKGKITHLYVSISRARNVTYTIMN